MKRRTILITGASGRLGSALVSLLSPRHVIAQLDIRPPEDPAQRDIGKFVEGSIADPGAVADAMDGVDAVIHAGAIPGDSGDRPKLFETNVMGTFVVLEAAAESASVEQFVYISSICWHGHHDRVPEAHAPVSLPINEGHPSFAVGHYGCTKVQSEFLCERYTKRTCKPSVAIRPPYIVALDLQATAKAGPPPTGANLCDYIATTDLVDGIERTLDYHPQDGFDRFLFHAVDQRSTMPSQELVDQFYPGVPVDREALSRHDGFGAFVDCSHARDRLGWEPRFRIAR
jgi:nucleoside-diphosphate-sugar epimerase